MKNTRKVLGIIAFIAVIGLIMPLTGCGDPPVSVSSYSFQPPLKNRYTVGQTVNLAGMKVIVNYSDKTSKDVTADCTIEGFNTTAVAAEITVSVKFEGAVAGTFKISVVDGQPVVIPTATPGAGVYLTGKSVTLSTTTEGAAIYYTIDGTTPTAETGTLFDAASPITITANLTTPTTIKAIGVADGCTDSDVLTAVYSFQTPIELTDADKFYDGSLSSTTKEQWFKFKATATTQYIHFLPGALSAATVQLYSPDDNTTVGASTYLSSSSTYTSRTGLTTNTDYYIKVSTSLLSGAYKIGFNSSSTAPSSVTIPTTGVTELTANQWKDGNITTAGGEQWFKFKSSTTSHYIWFLPGTLYSINVQLYTAEGRAQGTISNLYNTYTSISRGSLTNNTDYFIRVTPYYSSTSSSSSSGNYRIGFNTSSTTPPSITIPTSGVTTLSPANQWKDSTITAYNEQWFTFTSTAATQYIHIQPGTVSTVYVQLYNKDGVSIGTRTQLSGTTLSVSRTVTNNEACYILAYSASGGAYQIGFNTSAIPPNISSVPTATATALTADTWTDGNIATASGEQWFKFTATATSHYIHFQPGVMDDIYVRVYTADGTIVDASNPIEDLYYTSALRTNIASLTSGTVYYIRVTPYSSIKTGAYKIGFNSTETSPVVLTPPTANVINLTEGVFSNGTITSNGEQWFKFTSAASGTSAYIYFYPDTTSYAYVQLYTNDGRFTGNTYYFSSSTASSSITRTVTVNTGYYIKVTPSYTTGNYKLGYNSTATAPKTTIPNSGVVQMTAEKWSTGNISTVGGEQWFKFTSAASGTNAYIYFQANSLSSVYVQMYTADGSLSGNRSNLSSSYVSRAVTANTEYYIRVTSYSSSGTGSYSLGVTSSSSTTPTAP